MAEFVRSRPRVLIVTGGFVAIKERSLVHALRRQVAAHRASQGGWLDLQLKLRMGEELAVQRTFLRSRAFRRQPYRAAVERYFGSGMIFDTPELTEVVLMTLLAAEDIDYEAATYAELHADPTRRERLLAACATVFASTTLLRDTSELAPLVQMLRRPGNKIVCGGALASLLHTESGRASGIADIRGGDDIRGGAGIRDVAGIRGVNVWAVGHGELLCRRWRRGSAAVIARWRRRRADAWTCRAARP